MVWQNGYDKGHWEANQKLQETLRIVKLLQEIREEAANILGLDESFNHDGSTRYPALARAIEKYHATQRRD